MQKGNKKIIIPRKQVELFFVKIYPTSIKAKPNEALLYLNCEILKFQAKNRKCLNLNN